MCVCSPSLVCWATFKQHRCFGLLDVHTHHPSHSQRVVMHAKHIWSNCAMLTPQQHNNNNKNDFTIIRGVHFEACIKRYTCSLLMLSDYSPSPTWYIMTPKIKNTNCLCGKFCVCFRFGLYVLSKLRSQFTFVGVGLAYYALLKCCSMQYVFE